MSQANRNSDDTDEKSLEELCDSIANTDDVSDQMQDVAERIRDGIRRGEIDAT